MPAITWNMQPAVMQAPSRTPLAAQLDDAVLATKIGQNAPDLRLRRMQLACRAPDILHNLLGGAFVVTDFFIIFNCT